MIKSLQESIFHYQYSDWKETEKDPDLPEGNIGDAIYKLHEVPLYWWLTGLFLLYLTPGRIVCRVKIYIKIRSVDLKVFFFLSEMSRNLIRQGNQPFLLSKFNKNPFDFDLPSTVNSRTTGYVRLIHPPLNSSIDSPVSRCNLINLLKHMCLNKSTGWQYSHSTVAGYFPEFIYLNNA